MSKYKKYLGAWAIIFAIAILNAAAICSVLSSSKDVKASNNEIKPEIVQKDLTVQQPEMQSVTGVKVAEEKPAVVKYVVKPGDTLWDISSTYKIDVASIVEFNKLDSPDSLKVGQEVIIPGATELKAVKNSTNQKASGTVKLASRSSALSLSGSWPAHGNLTSRFGNRDGEFHKGIDIAAPTGTNVLAFA